MPVGTALVVILVGALVAAFLSSTIGFIVMVIGVIGLALALFSGSRARTTV